MKTAWATAPTRIDLAGGTLDIWPLYLLVPGSVTVNMAISRRARADVAPRPGGEILLRSADTGERVAAGGLASLETTTGLPLLREIVLAIRPRGGFSLLTRSGVPPGSGLGGSSSLAVAALRALSAAAGRPLSRPKIVPLARDVEARVIRVPTGTQDHIAAAYGGVAAIHLGPGAPEREALRLDVRALAARLVLAVVGASRLSATTNWEMVKSVVDGKGEARERMSHIARAARDLRAALIGGDLEDAARAMAREYEARRGLVPGIETKAMRRVHRAAREAGALAGKVCGAGGGGGMLFLTAPRRKSAVLRAVRAAGARPMSFAPDSEGLRT